MKSVLLLTTILASLAAAAKTPSFVGWPASFTCANADFSTFVVSGVSAEAAAVTAIDTGKAALIDGFGASDTATAHCNNVADPLYAIGLGGAEFGFAYNKKTDLFTFCYSEDSSSGPEGYPNGCLEVN